ncbi:FxLYD domain-containing protein [Alicyclobacillus acidoterrestris]|uniref:FxLYD domain-containing protein n=1 Tax=Alicyclobacillus acidoterrestris TaxID=1450 RepID=UPI003F530BFC
MKKIAIGLGGFIAGVVMTAGVTMAATTTVKAIEGTDKIQYNSQTVSSSTDLKSGSTTYLSLPSVESVLKKAGLNYKWSGSTLNVTSPKATSVINFSNIILKDDGLGGTLVDGIATNNDKKTHTFTVVVSFYDANGKLLGEADAAVDDLGAGQSIPFEADALSDYTNAASYKVQVQTLID